MTRPEALERTHCRRGHRLTEANTFFAKQSSNGNIVAQCRTCKRNRDNARTQRAREQRQETYRRVQKKAAARGLADDDPRHGTPTGYSYWGCRCAECTEAYTAKGRLVRLKQKARAMGIQVPRDKVQVRALRSLDAVAEQRFGMDRVMVGTIWDDPVGEEAVERLA